MADQTTANEWAYSRKKDNSCMSAKNIDHFGSLGLHSYCYPEVLKMQKSDSLP